MTELAPLENQILAYWKEHDTYHRLVARNSNGPKFFFVDGPPYATGQIHPGTAWNKCLKDSILRYQRAKGCAVFDRPGFDTHGLPIEVKVEQAMKLASKKEIETKVGIAKFISECKRFASQYIGVISGQFGRCGVWIAQDRDPAQPCLGSLQTQFLKKSAVIVLGHAPLLVVVGQIKRIRPAPPAPDDHDDPPPTCFKRRIGRPSRPILRSAGRVLSLHDRRLDDPVIALDGLDHLDVRI